MQFFFPAPISLSAEDNNSLITKKTVKILSSSLFDLPSGDFWNCNHCPNDDDYCQPFILGDKIYFQLKYVPFVPAHGTTLPAITYWVIINGQKYELQDGVNGVSIQAGLGVDDSINYINVVIDTSDSYFSDKDCFYFQVAIPTCGTGLDPSGRLIAPQDVKDCYDAKILLGVPANIALNECISLFCSDKYNTEYYCKVKCEENTLLIEGEYTKGYDCEGKYYGFIDDGFNLVQSIYKPIFRIRGVVEPNGFEFEESVNGKVKTKSKQREVFTLFSQKIPYYVVRQLSTCWNSGKLIIDSVQYKGAVKLTKNFDEGQMWILKESLYIECDEINFTCS